MSGGGLPGGYDAWRTEEPEYIPDDERPEGCECRRRIGDFKWCPVHGLDPDEEREKRRERQIDKEWGP